MIALGPISVRIGRAYYRLNYGQAVPPELEAYWRRTKQIDQLEKSNAISNKNAAEDKKDDKKADKKIIKKADADIEFSKPVKSFEKSSEDIEKEKE